MRTSLNNIQLAERYLTGNLPPGEKLLIDANRLLNADFDQDIIAQQKTYTLIQRYGRKQLAAEIEAVHTKLFSTRQYSSFAQKIWRLFN